jgi:hypothetical protein
MLMWWRTADKEYLAMLVRVGCTVDKITNLLQISHVELKHLVRQYWPEFPMSKSREAISVKRLQTFLRSLP